MTFFETLDEIIDGRSLREFARFSNIDPAVMCKVRNGRMIPNDTVLKGIARASGGRITYAELKSIAPRWVITLDGTHILNEGELEWVAKSYHFEKERKKLKIKKYTFDFEEDEG